MEQLGNEKEWKAQTFISVLPFNVQVSDSDSEIVNGVLIRYSGSNKSVIIPSGITAIGESAFYYCKKLCSISLDFAAALRLTEVSMLKVLAVGCGGFIGSISRYLLSIFITRFNTSAFPISTMITNVLGSLLIGLLTELLINLYPSNKKMQLFLTTGILGGFTTFSTFSLETINLYQNGNNFFAIANVILSIAFCLTGVLLGKMLGKVFINA
ncbi:MAG: fluoride efflux transporter CrcB [Ruminiclostridium sp.]